MESYKLIGIGTTDASGVARCNTDYTGTGKGKVDMVASLDNPIVEGSLQSEIYEVLDTLLYDTGIDPSHNIWTGNTSNLTRSNEYSTLAESEEGVAVAINTVLPKGLWVLEMKVKRDGGSTNWNITIMNGNTAIFGVATPTNDVWSDIKIVYDGAKIYCLVNGSLTPLKTQDAVLDDALTYHLRIQTPQTITYVDFKDLTVLRNDVDSITISATKGIIQTDETTILSGSLYESGVLVKNTSLDIYKNNVKLGTVQTDNNGVASYTYTGVGGGLCEFTFKVGRIQSETYGVIDGTFKDIGTSTDYTAWRNSDFTGDNLQRNSEYTTLIPQDTFDECDIVVSNDFCIEFDVNITFTTNNAIFRFNQNRWNGKGSLTTTQLGLSANVWSHVKLSKTSNTVAVIVDGETKTPITLSDTIDTFMIVLNYEGISNLKYKNFCVYPI